MIYSRAKVDPFLPSETLLLRQAQPSPAHLLTPREGKGGGGNLIIPFREADNTGQGSPTERLERIKRGKERYVSVWDDTTL